MVLFTKEYLPTSVLCFLVLNFPMTIFPTQVTWLQMSVSYRFPSPSPGVCLEKGRIFGVSIFAVPKFPNPTHLYYLQILCTCSDVVWRRWKVRWWRRCRRWNDNVRDM